MATSKSVNPPSTRSARSSAPTWSAPASSASRALSPLAKTATDSSRPRPWGKAIVHLTIGKTSFDDRALLENYAAVLDEIIRAKPAAAKGRYIRSITLASTMGPGIKVDPSRTRDILEEAAPAAA